MQVQIQSVDLEIGKPGAKGWSKAIVTYNYNGDVRKQNIMSFVNPAVFAAVQRLQGETVEVTLTKNSKGYDEWAAVSAVNPGTSPSTGTASPGLPAASAVRVTGSNYETPAERARRQVLIVRQSSLTAALKYLEGSDPSLEQVKEVGQAFVDFVFDDGTEEA